MKLQLFNKVILKIKFKNKAFIALIALNFASWQILQKQNYFLHYSLAVKFLRVQ